MLREGDAVVLFLLLILVLFFLIRRWKKTDIHPVVLESNRPVQGEIPEMLKAEGYEVVAAKQRLPLWIRVGEKQYESRLYADFIVRKGGKTYVVILAKAKKALRLSGAAVRDRFLAHVLAFQAAGVLYVDPLQGTLKTITFDVTGVRIRRRGGLTTHLIMLTVGALIAILAR
ncbi:hypothetical protein C8P63_12555 [Melghirimyces profundicolus]|uniref:Uncharacterized protein n=1 Tax=Melghirimyces profundicolus TaxID=1242148 RepID=A0A2T6BD18_9BACL|nr:hypothetical protein [Melghirimyces profundicolus]PTX53936.1 hypothetical protein C8P63_12555 [Melghirimyces profundicolus]